MSVSNVSVARYLSAFALVFFTVSSPLAYEQQRGNDNERRNTTRPEVLCVARSNGQVRIVDSRYPAVELESLSTPTFQLSGSLQQRGLHRISGGESIMEVATGGIGGIPQPGMIVTSDLVVTLVATTPGLKSLPDVRGFDAIYQWIGDVLAGRDSRRDAVVTPWSRRGPWASRSPRTRRF